MHLTAYTTRARHVNVRAAVIRCVFVMLFPLLPPAMMVAMGPACWRLPSSQSSAAGGLSEATPGAGSRLRLLSHAPLKDTRTCRRLGMEREDARSRVQTGQASWLEKSSPPDRLIQTTVFVATQRRNSV